LLLKHLKHEHEERKKKREVNKNKYRLGPRGPRLHESISACPPAALLAPGDLKCVFQSSVDASSLKRAKMSLINELITTLASWLKS